MCKFSMGTTSGVLPVLYILEEENFMGIVIPDLHKYRLWEVWANQVTENTTQDRVGKGYKSN